MSKARGWRKCGVYVHRARKPHAPIGLPIVGRHTAYVGESNSRSRRDGEHLNGSVQYGTLPSSWSDLDVKIYPLPALMPHWRWARKLQETLWIALLWPIYNDQKNRWNPRRIPRRKAAAQRAARDANRRMRLVGANIGRMIMRGVLALVFWGCVLYGVWEYLTERAGR